MCHFTHGGGGSLVIKQCPTLTAWAGALGSLCPWDFPGKNTHRWVAISSFHGILWPRLEPRPPCTAGRFFTEWATVPSNKWPDEFLLLKFLQTHAEAQYSGVVRTRKASLLSTPCPEALSPNENDQQQHLVWIFGLWEASSGPHCS